MSILYALDPGTEQSALVMLHERGVHGEVWDNTKLVRHLRFGSFVLPSTLVIEEVQSYGMAVGREVFETVFWSGRFAEAWSSLHETAHVTRLGRRAVKLALCGSMKAKDANIRQAIVDRYGGKERAIGKKAAPGPLYGIKSHCWAGLALALAYQDSLKPAAAAPARPSPKYDCEAWADSCLSSYCLECPACLMAIADGLL